jgi:ERCC4-type nuclease
MIIKIDVREKKLINILKTKISEYKDLDLKEESLDIGDIIIYDNSLNEQLIIERKTLNDLASSIRDGRYSEQSLRLKNCNLHNHNIIYLIEGDIRVFNNKYTNVNKKALYSAMFSLQYFKGFSLFRTFDLNETSETIIRFSDKMNREKVKKPYYSYFANEVSKDIKDNIINIQTDTDISNNVKVIPLDNNEDEKYSNVIKRTKKENITPENIGNIFLNQIPGVSNITSNIIMKEYHSVCNLIYSLKKDENCLHNLRYTLENGKQRKLNKNVIENIKKYLLYEK